MTTSIPSDVMDWATFNQILEMDEDPNERDFSRGIVENFFEQAEQTFGEMEQALSSKNLSELSQKGHFLKGSSAALGLTKVKNSCEKIQHLGANKDETGNQDAPDSEWCLERIKITLERVKAEYEESKTYLEKFFG